ncbi:sugar phosphate nucleotidyltransferase [Streptomyces sp. NRRL B-1347]|uniref:sugar phosphate nucleotidyltransferase n=1 Tax=Streptomyces sp. NRRL B-1347 TaxID=1476877 RepID=UPI0004C5CCB6|nr:sugar phosphate nucleotidyltransferase [Streptomyces sp. NRRL B-1347]
MKAVVMAGGEGSRLRPMTSDLPKPLLPVADRPIMEHVLRLLKRHRLDDTVVTVQFLASLIREQFGDGSQLGMRLSYATEPYALGTAGSVKNAAHLLGDEPFVVISGDALTDIDLTDLIAFHRAKGALVTVCLTRVPEPVEFGITVVDESGRVERFLEKPTWGQVFSDTVNTGIYVMEPEVLAHVAEGENVDWSSDVFPRLLEEGRPVYGYVAEGYWEDVGTHASYLRAQADVLHGRVGVERAGVELSPTVRVDATARIHPTAQLTGPVYVGPHAQIGAGARIGEHTVVGAHAVIDQGAQLRRVVVHPHAYAGPGAVLRGCVIGRNASLRRDVRIEEGSVLGAGCVVEEEAVVAADVLVYPGKTIEAGTTVNDSLIWESRATKSLFGPRGVRGALNSQITPDLAVRLASAFATTLPRGGQVAVARDHGVAAAVLLPAMVAALRAAGLGVRDLGHVPLPLARRHTAADDSHGGIVVTTTPGSEESVDIVFLDAHGIDLSPTAQRGLERVFSRREYRRVLSGEMGRLHTAPTSIEEYADTLTQHLGTLSGGRRLKVVVDAACGSTALTLPAVLGRLSIEALTVNNALVPASSTETPAERRAALHTLGHFVATSGADFGVRFDPTGERLSLVDEKGHIVADDRALLLLVRLLTAEAGGGRTAVPVTVSRTVEHTAHAHGGQVRWVATAPGDLNRAAAGGGFLLAADGAGAFVLPEFSIYADGIAAFVKLAALLARDHTALSELIAPLPAVHVRQRDLPTAWRIKGQVMRTVVEAASGRRIDTTDGVRVLEDDGRWALVLPDAAAPITRLWAEGPDPAAADALLDEWSAAVRGSAAA